MPTQKITADKDTLVADDDLALCADQSGLVQRAAWIDLNQKQAAIDRQSQRLFQTWRHRIGVADAQPRMPVIAQFNQIRQDAAHNVDWHGKADAGARTRWTKDGCVYADDAPAAVEQGTARVAPVDGRVRLDYAGNGPSVCALKGASQGADDAGGQRPFKLAKRIADSDGTLADSQIRRCSQFNRRQQTFRRIDLEQRQIGACIQPDYCGRQDCVITETHLDSLCTLNHMIVGQDMASPVEHEPGTNTFFRNGLIEEATAQHSCRDIDDRGETRS